MDEQENSMPIEQEPVDDELDLVIPDHGAQHVVSRNIEEELRISYLTYAMSVIISRALPDARDGMKPSQRRIIFAMHELGLSPGSRFRKCAKICGDTSGNYHPHGESVVYPTLVRMAQYFNLRYPLVDGQGNFGSIDGDPPAAMRYTEARLTHFAMMLLEDIDKDTVDYEWNYDETLKMPTVLPAKFPCLLCNGSEGIAVGMATSIPPHNIAEVCDGILALLAEPDITVDELMQYIKGPDFPTGGIICGASAIAVGYRTGRSIIVVRGRAETESQKSGKKQLVIKEIPYQLSKTKLIEDMVSALKAGNLDGITDIRDESDKDGIRLVVELRRGEDEETILNQLYKYTPLQTSFSVNLLALVANKPELLTIKRMLEIYRDHRVEVIRRRTAFLLDKAEKRAHIVEGLLIALDYIDEVIKIIRASQTVPDAQHNLETRFNLSDLQAEAILKMTLQRLTGLERNKLEEEYKQLQQQIKDFRDILGNLNLVYDIIREDIYEMKAKFGDARRTLIEESFADIADESLIPQEIVAVTISYGGYVKRQPVSVFRKQHRGGKGITGATTKEDDFIKEVFIASTHDYLLLFTNTGRLYWLKVYDVPTVSRTAMGRSIANLLSLKEGETITSMVAVRDFESKFLFMTTKKGIVKKTPLEAFKRPNKGGIIAVGIDEGDGLDSVYVTTGKDEVFIGTRSGMAARFDENDVRSMGRTARGVAGIKLRGGDGVVGMVPRCEGASLLTVCVNGYGKRTDFDAYRLTHRNSYGVTNISTSARNGKVVAILAVRDDEDIIVITSKGKVIRTSVKSIARIGRATQGVRIISLDEGDTVADVSRLPSETELNLREQEAVLAPQPERIPKQPVIMPDEDDEPSSDMPDSSSDEE
ncbi:MAG: DNA gyrase subunit A [Candidatus Brocadiia bacterium]